MAEADGNAPMSASILTHQLLAAFARHKLVDNALTLTEAQTFQSGFTIENGQVLAVTTDSLAIGVHFPIDESAQNIGYKSLAVNLSDLAAMGSEPVAVGLCISLPETNLAWIDDFTRGWRRLASEYPLLRTIYLSAQQGPLTIHVQAYGQIEAHLALKRSGAKVGDYVAITGTIGDAALGLRCYQQGMQSNDEFNYLYQRLACPSPRVAVGRQLRHYAHSCIDLSDGLLADLGHILDASSVGAEIHLEKLPLSKAYQALVDREQAWDLALSGGDDYELCFTIAPERLDALVEELAQTQVSISVIGTIVAQPGIKLFERQQPWIIKKTGYEHFAAH